jgi:hypothetical protein
MACYEVDVQWCFKAWGTFAVFFLAHQPQAFSTILKLLMSETKIDPRDINSCSSSLDLSGLCYLPRYPSTSLQIYERSHAVSNKTDSSIVQLTYVGVEVEINLSKFNPCTLNELFRSYRDFVSSAVTIQCDQNLLRGYFYFS